MGTYGFIRFSLPLLPTDAAARHKIVTILIVLSLIGIIYGALVCMMQKDMKKLIAYSSVSHLGFCTLGIFALNPHGLSGSVIQQINHGISTGALFLLIGVLYERRHTRLISEFGGLSTPMPNFAAIYMIATLSSLGLPLLNGFIGEFTILSGDLPGEPAVRGLGRDRHRAGRGLPAVALPAGDVWSGDQSRQRAPARSEYARIRDADSAGASGVLDWHLSQAAVYRAGQPVHQIVEQVNPGYYRRGALRAPERTAVAQQTVQRRGCAAVPTPSERKASLAKAETLGSKYLAMASAGAADVLAGGDAGGEALATPMDIAAFRHDFFLILPEVELALFGLAILLFDFMLGVKDKTGNAVFAMLGVIFSGFSLYRLRALGPDAVGGFNGSIIVDPFFLFFGMIFLIATALVILLSVRYLQIEDEHHGEYYALLLFATVGHDVHGLRATT